MRVLHLVKTSDGAEWALRQMRELLRLGVDVHAAMPPGGRHVQAYRDAGIAVHEVQTSLPMRFPYLWPAMFQSFRRLVATVQPEIIHSHFVGTTLTMRLALGRRHRTPRIFQVPGPLHLEHGLYRSGEIATAGPQDHWVATCRWTRDRYLAAGIDPEKVYLSYYGLELEKFTIGKPGILRSELRLSSSVDIAGMVAYMYAPKRFLGQRRGLKGHEDLVDAIALLQERRPDVHVVFAGGAWGEATGYEHRVCAYGRGRLGEAAHFLGTRSDVPTLYADFDVAVHPSHSENLGGAAESLLLGVPTVATAVGGFPDIVRPGETGWLVPPRNPRLLAAAMEEALANQPAAREMAARGKELVQSLLDVHRTAGDMLDLYERVLPHGPK